MQFVIASGGIGGVSAEPNQFRFDILWAGPPGAETPRALAEPEKIIVRLHLPDAVVEPNKDKISGWPQVANTMGTTFSRPYVFPWGRNRLDEAWIEVRLPTQTYWAELPYGFVCNPANPVPPAESNRGAPVLAEKMKDLPKSDRLVPWLQVEYDLGEIQNHWRLTANLANPSRAGVEVKLFQEPDKQMTPWQLDAPETGVSIKTSDGANSDGIKVASRRQGSLERYDTFTIGANGGGDNTREWGTVIISVDNKRYGFTVPSSLFKNGHGMSDPTHKQLLSEIPDLWKEELFQVLLNQATNE